MNMLAPLRRSKPKPPINLDAFIEEQLGELVIDTDELVESAPITTPIDLARVRIEAFIADEEAAIEALQYDIAERDKLNTADKDEIAQRKAAIAFYRGEQPKPVKGRAGK
jgi:hypothetical protein